ARVAVEQPPGGLGAVLAPPDLLPDRGEERALGFGEAADAEPSGEAREPRGRDLPQIELGQRLPADAAERRVVGAADDAARIVPGEDAVDAARAVAVRRKGPDLRQE